MVEREALAGSLFERLAFAADPVAGSLKHRDEALAAKVRRAQQVRAEIACAFRMG